VLSGFVLAHAYGERLERGLSTISFLKIRLIRLYPFYAVGVAVGAFSIGMSLLLARGTSLGNHDALTVTARSFGPDVFMAAFMLPALPMFSPQLYPLDQPAWSLLFELIGNAFYGFLAKLRGLFVTMFSAIVGLSALGLVYYAFRSGGINDGFNWAYFLEGLFRIGYSFPVGIFIYKMPRIKVKIHPFVLCIILALMLFFDPKGLAGSLYQLICVLVFFPLMVAIAATVEPRKKLRSIFAFLGVASYGLYATHKPLEELTIGLCLRVLHIQPDQFAPWSGFVFLFAMLAAISVLDVYFDRPVRRWLTRLNEGSARIASAVQS
jgi:peptidoglycan/LPS O-acetylase OafA/YrhL